MSVDSFASGVLDELRERGIHRRMRVLDGAQSTRMSVDGGPFQPQLNEAVRMELRPVPEPARWIVVMTAIPLLRWMVSRRRR